MHTLTSLLGHVCDISSLHLEQRCYSPPATSDCKISTYSTLQLDVRENPNLIFPPRPAEALEPSLEFYKVNFDINVQLRKAGANVPMPAEQSPGKLQLAYFVYLLCIFYFISQFNGAATIL